MKSAATIFLLLSLASARGVAEEVWLDGGDRASGHLSAMTADGNITLQSPLTSEPMQLRNTAVKKIVFGNTRNEPAQDMRLELIDGAFLLCNLKEVDASHVTLSSASLGDMRLPRTAVRSINFGMAPMRALFQSKQTWDGWQLERGWSLQNGVLATQGPGLISRDIALPTSFLLRCTLTWRESINLRMYAAENIGRNDPSSAERYYVHLHPGGIDVKRQSSNNGRRYTPLYSTYRTPDEFRDNKCELELRFDQQSATFYLYLNGQLEARFGDPLTPPLSCKQIGFESFDGDHGVRVSDIEVRAWDASSERYRTSERGNDKLDALIDSQGQRWAGQLTGITMKDNALKLNFTANDQPAPLTPSAKQVATVFFADRNTTEAGTKQWKLQLQDGSMLYAAACEIGEQRINLQHPALGTLSLPRQSVLHAERLAAPTP